MLLVYNQNNSQPWTCNSILCGVYFVKRSKVKIGIIVTKCNTRRGRLTFVGNPVVVFTVHQFRILHLALVHVEVPRTCLTGHNLAGGDFFSPVNTLWILNSESLPAVVSDTFTVALTYTYVTRDAAVAPWRPGCPNMLENLYWGRRWLVLKSSLTFYAHKTKCEID